MSLGTHQVVGSGPCSWSPAGPREEVRDRVAALRAWSSDRAWDARDSATENHCLLSASCDQASHITELVIGKDVSDAT